MTARFFPTVILVALLAWGSAAHARRAPGPASAERVEALAQAGSELVRSGAYREAIARFDEAYGLEPAAALLYNIAFVYDKKLGNEEQARVYYLRYIAAPDAEAEGVERARERLAVLRAPPRMQRPAPKPAPLPDPEPRAPVAESLSVGVPPQDAELRLAVLGPPPQDSLAWGFVGVGTVSLGVAIAFLRMADDTAAQANSAGEPDHTLLSARRNDQELIAWILLGSGAASALTGSMIFLFGEDDSVSLGLSPRLTPDLASFSLEARW